MSLLSPSMWFICASSFFSSGLPGSRTWARFLCVLKGLRTVSSTIIHQISCPWFSYSVDRIVSTVSSITSDLSRTGWFVHLHLWWYVVSTSAVFQWQQLLASFPEETGWALESLLSVSLVVARTSSAWWRAGFKNKIHGMWLSLCLDRKSVV